MARQELTERELLAILNEQLSTHDRHDTCAGCRFTSIARLRGTDETGCNWSHANLQCSGQPAAVCRPAADRVVSVAREKYNAK